MSESGGPIDLLVLGGGMAGLSAAAYASVHGASVVLVEKAPAPGGSAAYARFIHTPPTVEVMREVNPGGDPKLTRRLVEGYASGLEWVRSLGVRCRGARAGDRVQPRLPDRYAGLRAGLRAARARARRTAR